MTNYPVGDFLIQIKNAAMAGKREVVVDNTKFIKSVADALVRAKYLDTAKEENGKLLVRLAFHKKAPYLIGLKIVSTPGLRIYKDVDELGHHRGVSTYFISTPQGVKSLKEALKSGSGGEVIAEVW